MKDFQDTIDSKFAEIQKYINEYDGLSESQKENMISLCIEANDMILRIKNNPKDYT